MGQLFTIGTTEEAQSAGNNGMAAAKPKASVTFAEYKKVIGTAWESRGNVGNGRIPVVNDDNLEVGLQENDRRVPARREFRGQDTELRIGMLTENGTSGMTCRKFKMRNESEIKTGGPESKRRIEMKKAKINTTVIDTNVYGWHLSYALDGSRRNEAVNSFNLLSKILELKKPLVLGTETVEREIKEAGKSALSELFYSIVGGVIRKTEKIGILAKNYYDSCKEKNLRLVTIDDCEIVAAAAIAGAKIFVTENRRTLNNPKVVEVISAVNISQHVLKVKIMDSKNALGEIFV